MIVTTSPGNGADIEGVATAWAIRVAEGPLAHADKQALDAWLAEDSRHLGAFVRAQALWLDLDRVVALDPLAAPAVPDRARPRITHPLRYAVAASIAVLVMCASIAYNQLAGRVSTSRGEVRTLALDDGSIVTMNGGSTVQVRYDGNARRIVLRGGEASFKVAHNPARPFIVDAGGLEVRAVGTEFVVGMDKGQVAVTVEEGVVAIDGANGAAGERLLRRNEQFVDASTGARKAVLTSREVQRMASWRQGLLIFEGQTVGAAVEMVNRHTEIPVIIDDPTLVRAEFMGVLKIGDAHAFADAIAQAFNAEVIDEKTQLRVIRKRTAPSH